MTTAEKVLDFCYLTGLPGEPPKGLDGRSINQVAYDSGGELVCVEALDAWTFLDGSALVLEEGQWGTLPARREVAE